MEERSLDLPLLKVREVKLKKRVGKKNVNGKEYRYEYYTLPLLLYIPKQIAERSDGFVLEYYDGGVFVLRPKASKEGGA